MKAITREENQVVEMLLADPRTNVNLCSQAAGLTPLHIACATGNLEAVQMILAKPDLTSLNWRDKDDGISPLMAAVGAGRLEVVRHLVGIPEVDLQTIDNLGRTLIDVARDSHPLLVPVLQKKRGSKASKTISKERLKDERNIDDLLSFIEGPCANEKKEKGLQGIKNCQQRKIER